MLSSPFKVLCASCILMLAACGKPADRIEITDTVERSLHRPVNRVNATSEERFAMALPQTAAPMQSPAAAQGASPFDYTVPEGWTEIPATAFRNPNFRVGPDGEVECYASLLPGSGGSLFDNANRWRGQMGRAPYTEDEFAQLHRMSILGEEAVIADFDGTFTGMGQTDAGTGYRLTGALLNTPSGAVFIKMIGPDEAVLGQQDNFTAFVQSLDFAAQAPPGAVTTAQGALPEGHPPIMDNAGAAAQLPAQTAPGGFAWTAPSDWREVANSSSMRLVTFALGENDTGECYVVVLGGTGGGRLNNMNRWLGQMGEPPLDPSELELQPKVTLFGEIVPMLVAKGTYSGMSGDARPGYVMYGAIAELDAQSVYIKLIAPEAVANQHWNNFTAFCESLKRK